MRDRIKPFITPAIGLVMFAFAMWALHHALREYHYRDVRAALGAIPALQLLKAIACAAGSFFCLTVYDVLAFRYVERRLPYPRVAFTSFVAYSFSNTVGYSFLSGGSIRYRLYSGWALPPADITRVVGFCTLTGWLGSMLLTGVVLVLEPEHLAGAAGAHPVVLRALGTAILLAIGVYVLLCALRIPPIRRGEWEFVLPSLPLALGQLAVSAVDHAFVAGALYMLLPAGSPITYPAFVCVFMLALSGGIISQVPGGAGVFETLIVSLLSPAIPASAALGALLAYRAIYYLGPLGTGAAMLVAYELRRRRALAKKLVKSLDPWLSPIVPQVLAFTAFVNGAILLLSGATPAAHGRMELLRDLLPLPVIEASHFFASITGALLILLARALQRRVDAAYVATLALLFAGGMFSLLKGIDYEESAVSFALLGVLAPCRRYFYRRASLREERFSPGWGIAIALVLGCAVWLTLFAYKHVEYSNELWWHFGFRGDVHRSLRALVGASAVTMLFALSHLLRPARPEPGLPDANSIAAIRPIVNASPTTTASLALLGDKSFLVNDAQSAFIMYRVSGRSWIAMGDPVGPESEWVELIWRYREMSDRHSGWTVFYQVPASSLHHYLDLGLSPLKLGEEARVNLNTFNLDGGAHKAERNALRKMEKEGITFDIAPADQVPELLPTFRSISNSWMMEKNTREKGFSLGYFDEAYLRQFPHAVVRAGGKVVAFANILLGADHEEVSIDLMRHAADAPKGIMDFLFIQLMLWGKQQQYQWFNLGMAPFSGVEDRPLAPVWNRMSALLYRHGEHFYNFQGLRQYKEKFDPEWSPKYLMSPGGLALPTVLTNLATLISRGAAGVVSK